MLLGGKIMDRLNEKPKVPSSKGSGRLSSIEIAEIGEQAIVSITRIINTIGEERRKTAEIELEQKRINCELEAQICAIENETRRLLGQYQIELSKIANETRLAEIEAQKVIAEGKNTHEERMRRIETDHKLRMRQLDIFEKVIDTTLQQYNNYSSNIVITPSVAGAAPIINFQLLEEMNSAILRLSATLSRASLDASIL